MSSNPAHILVVDDNPATRYSTSRVLRSANWVVTEAESGEEALELSLNGVDLVVLDVNLPDIDGFEVCRRIRASESSVRIPVLHLSATFVKDRDKIHGLESGADGYLTHPIEPPVLIATVNAFLRTREAETSLRSNEARFKAIFNNALNGIVVLDRASRFIEVNPALCSLLGAKCEDVQKKPLLDFVPEHAIAIAQDMMSCLISSREWKGQLPLKTCTGDEVQLAWQVSEDESGLRIATVNDIGEQLRYEAEREALLESERNARADAENASRLKDDFLATLSHELRTPLSAIVGWSQLLNGEGVDKETLNEGLETIERNALVQSQMIADLLDVARITSGKIRLEVEQLYPAAVLDAAISAVQLAADAKGIRIMKVIDPRAGPVSGDSARLQQIFWNLLNNAVKFTEKQGRIDVALRRINSHVEIRVADNGRGLPSDMVTSIFERFRQADSSTTREFGGLGLGLAIAKQLVEMHGGTIHAESPGLGQGATFTVEFPLAPVHHDVVDGALRAGQDRLRQLDLSALKGLKILIVEDSADSRDLLKRIIAGTGAIVSEAASADRALELIPQLLPQLVISDVGMPGRDGLDFIQQVRKQGFSSQDLPAIALTAFAREEDHRRSLLAGFQIHLNKPVGTQQLLTAITSLIEKGNPQRDQSS